MLLNYTSEAPTEKTISDIQKMLSQHNVVAMMTEYEGPQVSAVSFRISVDGKEMAFKLPCNWRKVKEIMKRKNANRLRIRGRLERLVDESDEQAQRTAWAIIKDWMEAQLALVEVNMVTLQGIFLPYMRMRNGKTLTENIEENPEFLLGPGN